MKAKTLKKDKINVITLGCSKNLVDSEVMMQQLEANDFRVSHESSSDDNNIIIINTCGFIENAKQESIDTILQYADAKKQGLIDKLYVTGCLSQRYRDDLQQEIGEVDAWFGTLELPRLLKTLGADYQHELIGERLLTTPQHYAYMKIAEGCDRTCAFCAIPIMRGGHVSRPIPELTARARELAKQGVKELILIAQELTYYGVDIYKKRALAELLQALSAVDGIEWIRLHYAYPSRFPLEVIDVMKASPNICNYLDMPLQHISDKVLKGMKRQISKQQTIELIHQIRDRLPGIAIRTTMLVGFPGEREEDIEELEAFIRDMKFDRLGVFTYSHEEGTSAYAQADDVPETTKQERAARLMEVQEDISLDLNRQKIGRRFKTMIDRKEGEFFIGRTEYDSPEVDNEVMIPAANNYARIGDFAWVEVTDAQAFDLFGNIIPKTKI